MGDLRIVIDDKLHREVKAQAAIEDLTWKQVVEQALEAWLQQRRDER